MAEWEVGFDKLAGMEYPGRVIFVGRTERGDNFAAYAVTGRSESSRARILVENDGTVKTGVIDAEQLEKGNRALLIYNAIRRVDDCFIVSNGAQTDLVHQVMLNNEFGFSPIELLAGASRKPFLIEGARPGELIDLAKYEPDSPTYTPRITGVVMQDKAALGIIKRGRDGVLKQYFEVPLVNGSGYFIATYEGTNVSSGKAIPPFAGEPFKVGFVGDTAENITDIIWSALGPKDCKPEILSPGADFRVGVAAITYNAEFNIVSIAIRNRDEDIKDERAD